MSHFRRTGLLIARYVIGHVPSLPPVIPGREDETIAERILCTQPSYILQMWSRTTRSRVFTWTGTDTSYNLYVVIISVKAA